MPPVVVSGLPKNTPIFMRVWLIKTTEVFVLLTIPASLRSAWLINRACKPICWSPISPSISARGTRAATESITITSTALERTSVSVISRDCSPLSGWEINKSSTFTPIFFAYYGSRACSASTKAAVPPYFWTEATTCKARVVLPEASGP